MNDNGYRYSRVTQIILIVEQFWNHSKIYECKCTFLRPAAKRPSVRRLCSQAPRASLLRGTYVPPGDTSSIFYSSLWNSSSQAESCIEVSRKIFKRSDVRYFPCFLFVYLVLCYSVLPWGRCFRRIFLVPEPLLRGKCEMCSLFDKKETLFCCFEHLLFRCWKAKVSKTRVSDLNKRVARGRIVVLAFAFGGKWPSKIVICLIQQAKFCGLMWNMYHWNSCESFIFVSSWL